jgi:RNase P subunit RPR2
MISEQLPHQLKNNSRGDIPQAVVAQLNYLWNVCHEVAGSSSQLSHAASMQLKQLIREYDVALPTYITSKLCAWCSAVQIPSVTCSTRIRGRGKGSSVNRTLRSLHVGSGETPLQPGATPSAAVKVKNAAVSRCKVCSRKTSAPRILPRSQAMEGCNSNNNSSNSSMGNSGVPAREEAKTARNVAVYLGCRRSGRKSKLMTDTATDAAATAKKHKGGRNSSTSKISGNSSSNSPGLARPGSSPAAAGAATAGFSFLVKPAAAAAAAAAASRASPSGGSLSSISGFAGGSTSAKISGGGMNLLEMERARKKKKKNL